MVQTLSDKNNNVERLLENIFPWAYIINVSTRNSLYETMYYRVHFRDDIMNDYCFQYLVFLFLGLINKNDEVRTNIAGK